MSKNTDLEILYKKGEYSSIIRLYYDKPVDTLEFDEHYYLVKSLNRHSMVVEAIKCAETVYDRSLDELQKIRIIFELIWSYHKISDLDKAEKYARLGLKVIGGLKYLSLSDTEKQSYNSVINLIGIVHYLRGDLEKAITNFSKIIENAKNIGNEYLVQGASINLGLIYQDRGQYNMAINHFKHGLELAEKRENYDHIRVARSNLSNIFTMIGRIEEAERLVDANLKLLDKQNNPWGKAISLHIKGVISQKQGKEDQAINLFDQAIELMSRFENHQKQARTLFHKLLIILDRDQRVEARDILRLICDLTKDHDNPRIELIYKLGEAIYLSRSQLYKHKVRSEEVLREIINSDHDIESGLISLGYLYLIDLLLSQLVGKENPSNKLEIDEQEVVYELESISDRIMHIGRKQNAPELLVQSYYLNAHLRLIHMDIDRAKKELIRAEEISNQYGLRALIVNQPSIDTKRISYTTPKISLLSQMQKSINKIIHTLPRLKIMITLSQEIKLTFTELRERVDLSPGNLGNHCGKLIDAGYIYKKKEVVNDKFETVYCLTLEGIKEFRQYRSLLKPFIN